MLLRKYWRVMEIGGERWREGRKGKQANEREAVVDVAC